MREKHISIMGTGDSIKCHSQFANGDGETVGAEVTKTEDARAYNEDGSYTMKLYRG
jgi:hypothetical protein